MNETIQEIVSGFKRRHASVWWKDAEHCTCWGEGEDGIPDLPTDIEQYFTKALTTAYEKGRADAREEVKKKCEELMFINKSGHPLHHGYYQSALDDLRNFLSS